MAALLGIPASDTCPWLGSDMEEATYGSASLGPAWCKVYIILGAHARCRLQACMDLLDACLKAVIILQELPHPVCREDTVIRGDHTTSKALRMLVEDGFVRRTFRHTSMPGGGKANPYEYEVLTPPLSFGIAHSDLNVYKVHRQYAGLACEVAICRYLLEREAVAVMMSWYHRC